MGLKFFFLSIFSVVFGGIAGYLFYLYFEKKKIKDKEKQKEAMLSRIVTFASLCLAATFTNFTKNYFYMVLIFFGTVIGTSIIFGLILGILKKIKRNKAKENETVQKIEE